MGEFEESAEPQPDYLSYLVRLWRMQDGEDAWRGSIESPHSGERVGFASLDELFAFLLTQTGAPPDAESRKHPLDERKENVRCSWKR